LLETNSEKRIFTVAWPNIDIDFLIYMVSKNMNMTVVVANSQF